MDAATVEAYLAGETRRVKSQRPLQGETPDLGGVFDANAAALYRTILAYTGGRSDVAEEAVAEAFARATANLDRIRDPVPWLYRVAFNVATDELRRDRHRGHGGQPEQVQPSPEATGLFDAMRHLPPRERAAMVLFYVNDLSVAEVASRMGVASPTVRVHLMKGRRRLRELLGDDEVDD
ncbi:MAG TPA: sigma-70 family RNA polymerase sigma factor [Actinomycetota bacterium]|jgi:RNA polymerase sigma-70 factor (ECF subfamily)|nr:sigma-70 family RNA polymerase sigma factor [Actinomycetota bacterium]